MATRHKRKTNPCEGCRERKKKCSTGQPCERCKRLGITCHYIKQITPPTVDYLEMISNQELQQSIDELHTRMVNMEKELQIVRTNNKIKKKSDNTYQPNWQFSIGPLGITIHTDITTIQGLLFHIKALGALSESLSIPNQHFYHPDDHTFLQRHLLSSTLRRGNFQVLTKSIQSIQAATPVIEEEKYDTELLYQERYLMKQIVNVYFSCPLYNNVLFHETTFRRLFVNNQHLEQSPVACALCAVVLTMHCKHVIKVVPYHQQMQLANHFFKSARDLIAVEFDSISLETVITYLLMAIHKANVLRITEAKVYLDMALRVRQLLQDEVYNNENPSHPGEYETFKRIHKGFLQLCGFMQFLNQERGVPARGKRYMKKKDEKCHKQINGMIRNIPHDLAPTPLHDESPLIVRVLMKDMYAQMLVKSLGSYLSRVRRGKEDLIPLSYVIQTEESLKKVYFQKIPLDFQLASTIFEDDVDDLTFWERLKNDKRCDLASVSLATQYYQILVSLYEPFLPSLIKKEYKKAQACRFADLTLIRDDHHTLSSDDEEEDNAANNKKATFSVHAGRAQEICFKSAMIVVRLLEYQCTMLPACTIARPTLLSVWDIHMRNACLGMQEDEYLLSAKDVQIAREYAIRCIGILKRGYLFNAAERQIWEYYQNIEDQLLRALYGSNSPPTAHYFEPAPCC